MKLLIGWDDKRRKMLAAVEKLDLLDLTEATDEDIAVVEKFVWEVKNLIYQFSTMKPTEAMKMLNPKMGGNIDARLLASLTANMPRDVMLGVQRDWLPNLSAEVLRRMRGEPMMATPPQTDGKAKVESSETPAADSADGSDDSILPGNDGDILAEEKDDSILPGNDGDILAEEKDDSILTGNDSDILAEEKDDSILPSNDGDILAEEKDDSILPGKDDDILAENKDDEILPGDTGNEETAKVVEAESQPELPEPMGPEVWAEAGGWYRQDFAVLYKPVGHRDGFMRAWLDYTGAQYGNDKVKLAAPIFDMMSARQAQGQCAKCHSIDSAIDNSRKVNWAPFKVPRSLEKFTKFSHEPHFGLFDDKGCSACHVVNGQAKYRDTYKALDPQVFQSNFKPIQQQRCSTCHQTKIAGQSCSLCHVYHVDDVITPIMATSIAKQ